MTDWADSETIRLMLRELAEQEMSKLAREIPQQIAGNKFRVPPAMKEWMEHQYKQMGGTCDTYYSTMVGYGHGQMRVEWVFRQDGITMTFQDPLGSRMFILELIP